MRVSVWTNIDVHAEIPISDAIKYSEEGGKYGFKRVIAPEYHGDLVKILCASLVVVKMVTQDQAYRLIKKAKTNHLSIQFDGEDLDPDIIEKTKIARGEKYIHMILDNGFGGYFIRNKNSEPVYCQKLFNLICENGSIKYN